MNRTRIDGAVLAVAGLVGYVLGILSPYPGRAFAVTGVMVGVTLFFVGRRSR